MSMMNAGFRPFPGAAYPAKPVSFKGAVTVGTDQALYEALSKELLKLCELGTSEMANVSGSYIVPQRGRAGERNILSLFIGKKAFDNLWDAGLVTNDFPVYQAHPLVAWMIERAREREGIKRPLTTMPEGFNTRYPTICKVLFRDKNPSLLRTAVAEMERTSPNFFREGQPGSVLKPVLDFIITELPYKSGITMIEGTHEA